jgi:hypothetical protein
MVYEDVWLARPDNAVRTKVIARIDDLPTPAVLVRADASAFAMRFKDALLAFAPADSAGLLYAGFADYQTAKMERFFAALQGIPPLTQSQPERRDAHPEMIS